MWHQQFSPNGGFVMWHDQYGQGFGYGMGFFPMMAFGFFKLFGILLFLALLFLLFRLLTRGPRYAGYGPGSWGAGRGSWRSRGTMAGWFGRDEALETARERLARSEITPEQFETIRSGLEPKAESRTWDARGNHDGWRGWRRDDALDTARMRFARGEISGEEFEMIRKALET
jgi:putative membrane protein